jgi:hypothetical protein
MIIMKTTLRLLIIRLLPLALALSPACTTYRTPQATTIPTCVDPSHPCARPVDNTYAWVQTSMQSAR